MFENSQRFVLSFLHKRNYEKAFKGEIICDENTGELLVKREDGNIVSFDSSTRRTAHIDTLTEMCNMYGFRGDIYEITDNATIYPSAVNVLDNILDGDVIIDTNCSSIIISVDADAVVCDDVSMNLNDNVSLSVAITTMKNGEEVDTIIKSHKISSSTEFVIQLPHNKDGIDAIKIGYIKIARNSSIRAIVHGILIATNI